MKVKPILLRPARRPIRQLDPQSGPWKLWTAPILGQSRAQRRRIRPVPLSGPRFYGRPWPGKLRVFAAGTLLRFIWDGDLKRGLEAGKTAHLRAGGGSDRIASSRQLQGYAARPIPFHSTPGKSPNKRLTCVNLCSFHPRPGYLRRRDDRPGCKIQRNELCLCKLGEE